jgi:pyruvate/2-oxoglutarate dehydrogenase complex dihydrolipoamide acyltransferase (E2) component
MGKLKLKAGIALLFLSVAAGVYSQDEMMQRGTIPEELLRPRREEAPRYPVYMVIGPLGQGQASMESFQFARSVAEALLAGNAKASSLSTANKMLVENCINALNVVSPRYFRMGSGRTEPDGSTSFLVRFAGREEGMIGEMFIRFTERQSPAKSSQEDTAAKESEVPPPEAKPPEETPAPAAEPAHTEDPAPAVHLEPAAEPAARRGTPARERPSRRGRQAENPTPAEVPSPAGEQTPAGDTAKEEEVAVQTPPPPPPPPPVVKIWIFEDLILEEPRSREDENRDARHRFDFSPYERFY